MRCRSSIRRDKLKDAIISELAVSTSPLMAINPELIHLRSQQFFRTLQTPIHPPYSSMIQQAILKLNEECGSSEEDISRFLEKEYQGLPWAHASFLSHHLEKLCRNGEIACVNNERYMLHVDDGDFGNEEMSHRLNVSNIDEKEERTLVQGKQGEVEAFDGWSGVNGDQVPESENRCEVERQNFEASSQNTGCERRMEGFEEQMEGRRESFKEVQEQSQNLSGQIEAIHHLKMLWGNGETVCGNNEQYIVLVDDVDVGNEEISHGLNISNSDEKEDRTLVQGKGSEVERQNFEVSAQNTACDQRTEGFEEQKAGRKEPLKEVQEESQNFSGQIEVSHHLEKHGEIDCAYNERYMVHMDDGDLENEDEEMSHRLSILDRDERKDQTLVQVKGREVEAIDGWSGINDDQAVKSENRCEVERHGVEVSGQNKACEERTERFEEQKEGRRESLKEVQEESQNFSGQIEVAEEVDVAEGKLTKVARKRRGQKRKRQEKTKRQIKVLKDDIPRPMMEDKKKYIEERQQQMKGGSGVMKSAGKQDRPLRGKIISEQDCPQDPKIDIRTKMPVFPCDGEDVKNLKTSLPKRSVRLLEKQKKEALKHEELQERKLYDRERGLFIVCALPASQSRTNIDPKAHTLLTDSTSASLESRELGKILLRQLKLHNPGRPADLRGNTSERFTQSVPKSDGMPKNLELEKQEQQFQEPEKLREYETKTKQANSGSEEAAVSLSIKVKDSLDQGHQTKQTKVYVRRNVSKSQLKEFENSNILSSNSE